jgi:hypothetical protein
MALTVPVSSRLVNPLIVVLRSTVGPVGCIDPAVPAATSFGAAMEGDPLNA